MWVSEPKIDVALSRLFKSQIGCSLKDCVHSVRLEAAAGLVLSGESFHAAARRCGLRDGSEIRASLATGGQRRRGA